MITSTDAISTIEFENYYVILPSIPIWDVDEFRKKAITKKENSAKTVSVTIAEQMKSF